MELQQDTPLSLPLFQLDDNIESRDMDAPDAEVAVLLSENLLANLCQNPEQEQSISFPIDDYELSNIANEVSELLCHGHQLQLILNRGPVLSAVLNTDNGA